MVAKIVPTAAALAALAVAGCAATAPKPHPHAAATQSAPAGISYQQGVSICTNLNDWLLVAVNQDRPRFGAQMHADETEAAGTVLGTDLENLDTNLQEVNGLALVPQPPGYTGSPPLGLGPLQTDCAQFAVTVTLPGTGG
jgi:hypothetical protein